jgi:hypothetical protein
LTDCAVSLEETSGTEDMASTDGIMVVLCGGWVRTWRDCAGVSGCHWRCERNVGEANLK